MGRIQCIMGSAAQLMLSCWWAGADAGAANAASTDAGAGAILVLGEALVVALVAVLRQYGIMKAWEAGRLGVACRVASSHGLSAACHAGLAACQPGLLLACACKLGTGMSGASVPPILLPLGQQERRPAA